MQSESGMNDLNKALGDIGSIRRQVAHSTEFRGYGPATLAGTGALAIAAAGAQALWLPDPANHMPAYLSIWIWTAVFSAALIGTEMHARTRRVHSGMADAMIRMAVEQFLPSAGAGTLVAVVLVRYVPAAVWMLPGLWQIIFSLGVFASCRFLPRQLALVGVWYLASGLVALALVWLGALSRHGFETAIDYTAPAFWFFFLLVGLALFRLRHTNPLTPRPFQVAFAGWPEGWRVAAARPEAEGGYLAADHDTLVDSPFELGTFRMHQFSQGDCEFRFAVTGDHRDPSMPDVPK